MRLSICYYKKSGLYETDILLKWTGRLSMLGCSCRVFTLQAFFVFFPIETAPPAAHKQYIITHNIYIYTSLLIQYRMLLDQAAWLSLTTDNSSYQVSSRHIPWLMRKEWMSRSLTINRQVIQFLSRNENKQCKDTYDITIGTQIRL